MWKCTGVILLEAILCIQLVDLKLLAHTELGTIQGLNAEDGDYVMFLGIPYARVNASNPFGASLPVSNFDGVFRAFNDSVICPQIEEFSNAFAGIVDCLRLNIYVPNTDTQNKSVLFYLHGGMFRQGHSSKYLYGPKYLVRHDVIVVIINYRLGPYGFLCTGTPEIPGNQGLKDQYTALNWIKNNIHAFGGNPQKITIVGHSAGGMCVDIHLLTKQPRLFQQAILQSGSATIPRIFINSDKMATINIARKLGLKTDNVSEATSFLANTDPEFVIKASISNAFGPCVEKSYEGVFGYVTEHPESSKASNVDGLNIMGGFTNQEFLFALYGNALKDRFNHSHLFRDDLDSVFDFHNVDEISTIVKHFYLGDGENDESNKYKVVNFLSDFNIVYPIMRTLSKYSTHRNTTIYQYLFSYDGNRNFFKTMYNVSESGATHADELGYIFYTELNNEMPNAEDQIMIDKLTTLWTNFVKHGNPTPSMTDLLPVIWPRMMDKDFKWLQIDRNLEVVPRPFHKNLAFWDLVYEAYKDRIRTQFVSDVSPIKSLANVATIKNILFYVATILLIKML